MNKLEAEQKIKEGARYLQENRAERAELWMTRLLAEELDATSSERAILRGQATELMGRAQFAMGRQDEAIGTFNTAAQDLQNWLASHQKNATEEEQRQIGALLSGVLENLSFACMERKQLSNAESYGKEAIAVARQYAGANSAVLARALFGVSASWYRKGDYENAAAMLEEAKKIFQTLGDQKMVAFCLNNLGRVKEEQGKKEEGISLHSQAVALRRKLGDELDLAFSLGNLGVSLASADKWNEAAGKLAEAVEIYARNGKDNLPEAMGFARNLEICRQALGEIK